MNRSLEVRRLRAAWAGAALFLALGMVGCGKPTTGHAGGPPQDASGAAAAAPAAAGTGGLADGEYDFGGGYTYRAMGKVDIQGATYRYRPYDEVVNGFQAYSVTDGHIQWSGQFGGLDDPPAKIVDSTVEPFGFNVQYQGEPGALINTMSCHAPGK